ncbi:hypothetical protein Ancab_025852 [Ancistrocladus abbreviatus]
MSLLLQLLLSLSLEVIYTQHPQHNHHQSNPIRREKGKKKRRKKMGRAPCCDKANVKKGPWSSEEDAKLKSYIEQHGTGGNWIALPQKIGLKRCGKSCRLRWLNYLRPNIKHGGFSEEEENIICGLYVTIGSRWSIIAAQLPGRTDNDIKNYWNTRLKKKLLEKQRTLEQAACRANYPQQELRTEEGQNFMVNQALNQLLYWPEQQPPIAIPPMMTVNQDAQIEENQQRLTRLPIKVEGAVQHHVQDSDIKFDQYDPCNLQDQLCSNSFMNIQVNSNNTHTPWPNMQYYYGLDTAGETMYQTIPLELDEIMYGDNKPRISGMEMGNCSSGTSASGESTSSWGDVSCLAYQGWQREMLQFGSFVENLST